MQNLSGADHFRNGDGEKSPHPYRIFLVDDHAMFRKAVANWVNSEAGLTVSGEADTFQNALAQLRQIAVNLVIVDIALSGINGLELIKHLHAEMPKLKILVLSMHDEDRYAARSLKAGASGFLMKRAPGEELIEAIHTVLRGETYLSPAFRQKLAFRAAQADNNPQDDPLRNITDRELEILRLIGSGQSTRQIAVTLRISIKTVETHRLHLKEKLKLASAADLVRFATEWTELQDA